MEGKDLASWCRDVEFRHGICYKSAHICCVTCANVDKGTEYCRYGDAADWCWTRSPGDCYVKSTEDACCETCQRHLIKRLPECRYGDRYKWCRNEHSRCHEADIRENCCHTCADYKEPTTVTSTTTTQQQTMPQRTQRPGVTVERTSSTTTTTPTTTTTTTTTPTTTRSTTTTTGAIKPIECPDGDDASWCPTIPDAYCYVQEQTCCATCQQRLKPAANQKCRYGDKFTWCANISPSRCSESPIQDDCCYLCKDHETESFNPEPACTTDAASWCSDIHPRECYQPSTRQICCQTCKQQETQDAGCEFGDKTPVCEGLDCMDANIRDLCCQTCAKKTDATVAVVTTTAVPPTGNEGCQGDTVSWCRTIKSLHCYSDNDVCCHTCLKFYLGFRGCEYGDRVSWCADTITQQSDCQRQDIGHNCCYTCALRGSPSTRENPEEWREGVLVGFYKKDMSKIIADEMDMLMFLSHQVNEFCLDNPQHCCTQIYGKAPSRKTDLAVPEIMVDREEQIPFERQSLRLVLPSDCQIAGGYPRQSENSDGEIVTKYLVKLRPDALEPLCKDLPGNRPHNFATRQKRDIEHTIYFDKHTLRDLIIQNKDIIESAMDVQITRVTLSGEVVSTGFKVVIGIAIGAIIVCIIVSIALFITIRKLIRTFSRRPTSDVEEHKVADNDVVKT